MSVMLLETWQNDQGEYKPTKGAWDRTAGELIQLLNQSNGDIGSVLGDYNPRSRSLDTIQSARRQGREERECVRIPVRLGRVRHDGH
ncbi:hypothetical protein ACFSND_12250 [Brevibacillus brevis]|uniref:hypothetical protein n=1 Tax=Brevibacillus brevis TaxID=1393 RepID=UPI0036459B05